MVRLSIDTDNFISAQEADIKTWMDTIELSLGYSIAQHELEINKLMADVNYSRLKSGACKSELHRY